MCGAYNDGNNGQQVLEKRVRAVLFSKECVKLKLNCHMFIKMFVVNSLNNI